MSTAIAGHLPKEHRIVEGWSLDDLLATQKGLGPYDRKYAHNAR
jgi:hypothetical protein